MKISILIVNYFRRRLTEFCINTINETIPRPKFELLVVDNNSPDDSRRLLLDLKDKGKVDDIILNDNNIGEMLAFNQGIEFIRNNYNGDFFLWMIQDFFCMKGWYENVITVVKDLELDWVSCCFLDGLSNGKVVLGDYSRTKRGGYYSPLMARGGKWIYDVGHAPLIKMDHVRNFNIKSSLKWEERYMSTQVELYKNLQVGWKLKGVRLGKPSILHQDPEHSNPEYIPYYKFALGRDGIDPNKWLRYFQVNGYFENLEEYYKESGYKVSKFYKKKPGESLDWRYDPGEDPEHGWK